MKLYLIRHGDAAHLMDCNVSNDSLRPLTEKGKEEARNVGLFLKRQHAELNFLFHSTLLRSFQTAEIAAKIADFTVLLEEQRGIAPEDDPEAFATRLGLEKRSGAVVSHLPFLHLLASHLLNGSGAILPMKYTTGSIVCLEKEGYSGWMLRSFIPSKVLANLL